ncbi:MAG: NAD(P)H-quinone oxidoreductase [Gemmatimonadales bacterium]
MTGLTPRTMRVVRYRGVGGREVLSFDEVARPEPGSGEVLVKVAAAGLNRADVVQRRGLYPAPPGWPPDIPGLEYAGVVEGCGPGVSLLQPGIRVMGLVGGGAHAEYVVVHEREAIRVPALLSEAEAAAVPEAFLTAFDALVARGRLQPGERVLIHAVGSGIGTVAVQLARWLGATVLGTSRTADKLVRARELGLELGIDTSTRSFRDQLTAPVDVILDFFGGGALADNLASLAPRGRLVVLGTMQGAEAPSVDVGRILRGRLEVIGSVMRSRAHEERVPMVDGFVRQVLPEIAAGRLRPIVGAVYPMTAIAEAHEAMEANDVFGKIVLAW